MSGNSVPEWLVTVVVTACIVKLWMSALLEARVRMC
jgi:hypothetical protein